MNAEVRAIKTPAEQALADTYAKAKGKLPGGGAVAALRDAAFRQFDVQGLPHRRVEEWKYTDLRALIREALPLASAPDATAKAKAAAVAEQYAVLNCRRIIFVDGVFAPDLSDLSPEPGLTISSLADSLAVSGGADLFETKDPLVALNTALMSDGAVIAVKAGTQVARPVLLLFVGTQRASVFARSYVLLEKGARLQLIEVHEAVESQTNSALELDVADDAQIDHVKITHAQGLHVGTLMATIGAKATFNTFAFTSNSALVRNQTFLRFDGDNTDAAIGGVSLLKDKQHVDSTLIIQHFGRGCTSRERFRSVLDGQSRAVFQGKIIVEPGAQKTDAKMLSNALLLSDDAEADNKPELEIFADDVQCGHGATAGALDQDLLFYLRARGIPEQEAEALLIQAFIGEVIDMIAQDKVRAPLMDAAVEWLRSRA